MRVEVWYRPEVGDGRLRSLGFGEGVTGAQIRDIYIVDGVDGLEPSVLRALVCDAVAQQATVAGAATSVDAGDDGVAVPWSVLVEVAYRPGVTDPVASTLRAAVADMLGAGAVERGVVQTARQYRLPTEAVPPGLFNPLIQHATTITAAQWRAGERPPARYPTMAEGAPASSDAAADPAELVVRMDLARMSTDELARLSEERLLALSDAEMAAIAAYYRRPEVAAARSAAGIGEQATDVELEMLAQTWSEHCKHKIFSASIEYSDADGSDSVDSIFDTYIRQTTRLVAPDDGFLRSVFHDNSGVVEFDADTLVCFKVETHNSPSALDPYGGAITGIVGVNRDILGTGRGARPIFNTNVLCFAPPATADVPAGLLPPRVVMEGVHRGIVDGGNQSGIPVAAGAVLFDPSFVGKPLVFCGTGGILPAYVAGEPAWESHPQPGDVAVMAGGRIGKDGIHGATFSSLALDEAAPLSAVQIGDPIVQKRMSDMLLAARDRGLYRALTDNGAGGLSSSFGEMARECGGIRLDLERAPLKYPGLAPWEILLSEAQERMSLAVPPARWPELQRLAAKWDVEVSAVGTFTDDGSVDIRYAGSRVGLLDLQFLHDGLPKMRLQARWDGPSVGMAAAPAAGEADADTDGLAATLLALLAEPNIASKQDLVRQYDHEVQAATIGKPFTGVAADGPSDGAVLRPKPDSRRGLTVAHGICPWYSPLDTYHMAMCAVDEAVRAHVACGGDPDRMTALDNFCWPDPIAGPGNPDGEHKLAQLVRAARGLADACLAYRLPLISGKDSMKNDAVVEGRKISVLPTLLVSVMGIVPDVEQIAGTDFLQAGHRIWVVGEDRGQLGGSSYARLTGQPFTSVPTAVPEQSLPLYRGLHRAMRRGLLQSIHDLADGGLAVALAESAIGGRLGAEVDVTALPGNQQPNAEGDPAAVALFSETAGRFLISVAAEDSDLLEGLLPDGCWADVGEVVGQPQLAVRRVGVELLRVALDDLVAAWQTPI